MIRKIKFRTWIKTETLNSNDTRTNGFLTYDIQDIDFEDEQVYFGHSFVYPFKEVILQQYTGLKDINDKEIYEGDICRFDNNDTFIVSCEEWLQFFGKWIGEPECEDQLRDWYRAERSSVIGNIFENPELLTGEKC